MTFWQALKESFLEWLYGGPIQLDLIRKQDQHRKECERIVKEQYDAYRAGRF